MAEIDYDALANEHGGTAVADDYDHLASQFGGEEWKQEPVPTSESAPTLQPESPLKSAFRKLASEALPAVGTALGAAGAGALATPETLGAATIPAAIAGGAAGGYAGKKLQNALMGEEWAKQNEAQMAVNEKANPLSSTAGGTIPMLVSMAGGGGTLPKVLKVGEKAVERAGGSALSKEAAELIKQEAESKFGKSIINHVGSGSIGGMRYMGSQTAQRAANGEDVTLQDYADSMARGAIEFGPLGLLPEVNSFAKAAGYALPQAAATALSGAIYDSVVHGKPFSLDQIKDQSLAEAIPFAVFNTIAHGVHKVVGGEAQLKADAENAKIDQSVAEAQPVIDNAAATGQTGIAEALKDTIDHNANVARENVQKGVDETIDQQNQVLDEAFQREMEKSPEAPENEQMVQPSVEEQPQTTPTSEMGAIPPTEQPIPTSESGANVPFMVTRDMRQQLADLGYSRAEINAMKPAEAGEVISRGQSKQPTPEPNALQEPSTGKVFQREPSEVGSQGVNVDEWNKASKGKRLPKKASPPKTFTQLVKEHARKSKKR